MSLFKALIYHCPLFPGFHRQHKYFSTSAYLFCGFSTLLIHEDCPRRDSRFSGFQSRSFTVSQPCTIMDIVKSAVRQGSLGHNVVALRSEGQSYTYSQLIFSAWKISNLLRENLFGHTSNGIEGTRDLGGMRIGVIAKPSAEFVACMLGTWLIGGVVVPLALSYPEAELFHVMNDSDISMILSTEDHQEVMKNIAAKSAASFSLIPLVSSVPSDIQKNVQEEMERSKVPKEVDPALIVYTSGTTGKPKGVVHTHRGINAQVRMLTEAWEYSSSDKFLHCLPLHHVHGLFNALLAPIYVGAMVEFMSKFSVRGIWQRLRESYPQDGTKVDDAITVFTGVPTMYSRLLQGYESMDPELQTVSAAAARQLRLMMCGSSALPYPVMEQWERITGHRLLERYGMTEFVMALSNPLRGVRKAGTVGKPLPGVQVKILSEEDGGNETAGVGELCVKSPSLFKEYWKRPEVTKDSFVDGGYFKTSDTIKLDEDGYFVILGRTSADIMKVGGYKLSALEIEAVLLEATPRHCRVLCFRFTRQGLW
ncbi:hypothetical protein Syun_012049 [Stephania yunnanensis]|uniref:AMP-dependent synthetase/ligase domain-containing protein n=1 Tax=Stephania yunnanensis TaxID=152371 RepID=A0AAP0JZH7_9MAGN